MNRKKYALEHSLAERIFNALMAIAVRSRTAITAVFLGLCDESEIDEGKLPETVETIKLFLKDQTRSNDFVFKFSDQPKWFIILTLSGEREAAAFLRRLYSLVRSEGIPSLENRKLLFSASVAEIAHDEGNFEKLMAEGSSALEKSLDKGPEQIEYIASFKKKPSEIIRVSILEENVVFRDVLCRTISNLKLDNFETEIREFRDGYEFLQSDWYLSSHTHLVIMNDILPRQSGLDVLHKLRALPNNKKFIIFMMTKGRSEEDKVYAYESGADNYLIKPFNLRLLEVKIKRTFERLCP